MKTFKTIIILTAVVLLTAVYESNSLGAAWRRRAPPIGKRERLWLWPPTKHRFSHKSSSNSIVNKVNRIIRLSGCMFEKLDTLLIV